MNEWNRLQLIFPVPMINVLLLTHKSMNSGKTRKETSYNLFLHHYFN